MPDAAAPDDRLALLRAMRDGNAEARRTLLGLCYTEMRRLAHRLLRGDAAAHRLQPTEVVHEAAMRVLDLERLEWRDRAHLLAAAAPLMRQALLDELRRSRAARRDRPEVMTALYESDHTLPDLGLERLDRALRELQAIDPQRARLVELRFFGGLGLEEAAEVLQLTPALARRRWEASRAWLQDRLSVLPETRASA